MTYHVSWKQRKSSMFYERQTYTSFFKAAFVWLGLHLIRRTNIEFQIWG